MDAIKHNMVGAEYFPPVLAQQMIFMYGHPQNNPWLEIKTAHGRAPLRENLQNNGMFELL